MLTRLQFGETIEDFETLLPWNLKTELTAVGQR